MTRFEPALIIQILVFLFLYITINFGDKSDHRGGDAHRRQDVHRLQVGERQLPHLFFIWRLRFELPPLGVVPAKRWACLPVDPPLQLSVCGLQWEAIGKRPADEVLIKAALVQLLNSVEIKSLISTDLIIDKIFGLSALLTPN